MLSNPLQANLSPVPVGCLVGGFAVQIRKTPLAGRRAYLAERVGFEPTVRYERTPDFECGVLTRVTP